MTVSFHESLSARKMLTVTQGDKQAQQQTRVQVQYWFQVNCTVLVGYLCEMHSTAWAKVSTAQHNTGQGRAGQGRAGQAYL